ncbi:hypothetical protein Ddc_02097 [Ditylenchus destructor]|nr:hypothetical protein Ddc_02097 [Ditylenchus destructor]
MPNLFIGVLFSPNFAVCAPFSWPTKPAVIELCREHKSSRRAWPNSSLPITALCLVDCFEGRRELVPSPSPQQPAGTLIGVPHTHSFTLPIPLAVPFQCRGRAQSQSTLPRPKQHQASGRSSVGSSRRPHTHNSQLIIFFWPSLPQSIDQNNGQVTHRRV